MKTMIQAAVTLFAASAAHAQQAVQWRVQDGGNGHWYQARSDQLDWANAKSSAERAGGHLATITSSGEMSFAFSVTGAFPHWLGGKQAPGSCEPLCGWQWITGEAWSYANWSPAEPNNMGPQDTLKMYEDGTWDDTCGCELQRYLIEWSADCNGDGQVDFGQILRGQLVDNDEDGVPDACQTPTCAQADIYRDSEVNGADLGILLAQWGPVTPATESDLDHDGTVGGADLGLLLSFWGACP